MSYFISLVFHFYCPYKSISLWWIRQLKNNWSFITDSWRSIAAVRRKTRVKGLCWDESWLWETMWVTPELGAWWGFWKYQLTHDDGSGDYYCNQLRQEDESQTEEKACDQAFKSSSVRWSEPIRETKENKPDRLRDNVWALRNQEKRGFQWLEWSALLNATKRTSWLKNVTWIEWYRGHCWLSWSNLVERWGNLEVEEKETTNCIMVKRKEIHR